MPNDPDNPTPLAKKSGVVSRPGANAFAIPPAGCPIITRNTCLSGFYRGQSLTASSHSVSHWIGQLRAGDRVAAQHVWEGYITEEKGDSLPHHRRTLERKLDLIRRRWTV